MERDTNPRTVRTSLRPPGTAESAGTPYGSVQDQKDPNKIESLARTYKDFKGFHGAGRDPLGSSRRMGVFSVTMRRGDSGRKSLEEHAKLNLGFSHMEGGIGKGWDLYLGISGTIRSGRNGLDSEAAAGRGDEEERNKGKPLALGFYFSLVFVVSEKPGWRLIIYSI